MGTAQELKKSYLSVRSFGGAGHHEGMSDSDDFGITPEVLGVIGPFAAEFCLPVRTNLAAIGSCSRLT